MTVNALSAVGSAFEILHVTLALKALREASENWELCYAWQLLEASETGGGRKVREGALRSMPARMSPSARLSEAHADGAGRGGRSSTLGGKGAGP